MVRTNYVLVDFESVQPDLLDALDQAHFKLLIFVGATQAKLSFDIAEAVQKLGARAEHIKISGSGPNALDFHIAYYIGKLAATDPAGYFHIISKDKGFDPLIQYLKSQKIFSCRTPDIANIPAVKTANTKSTSERTALVLKKLLSTTSKPKTVKKLSSTIGSLFQNQKSDEEIASVLQELQRRKPVVVTGTKVTYTLLPISVLV